MKGTHTIISMMQTAYTYDERGSKLTQTDANEHTTSWGYDKYGRLDLPRKSGSFQFVLFL